MKTIKKIISLLLSVILCLMLVSCNKSVEQKSDKNVVPEDKHITHTTGDSQRDDTKADNELIKTSIILDWAPNTNHTGVFVAQAKGYYAEAGLEVEIKGFAQSGVESVLATGGADFGISYLDGLAFANASGANLMMIYNLQQEANDGVAVNPKSGIERPRDLDGKTWAAITSPVSGLKVKQMIINDGGEGEFESVQTGMSAYEAVMQNKADFAVALWSWEGINFELRGTPLKFFFPQDYGVESTPCGIGIAANKNLITENPDLVKNFISSTKKGYDFALEHPEEAAEILVHSAPEAKLDSELVKQSQIDLSRKYWRDERGETGLANLERWQKYLNFLQENGIVLDKDGKVLTEPQRAEDLVTNEFVK